MQADVNCGVMEVDRLLKEEINQTLESLHDFAKWKLIVTSVIAGAALGLTPGSTARSWLVLFIPYACAYVDLNCYQYLIRITVIARCLRQHGSEDLLHRYEELCQKLRDKHGVFKLGQYAQVGASLGMSIVAPLVAALRFAEQNHGDSNNDFILATSRQCEPRRLVPWSLLLDARDGAYRLCVEILFT